MSFSTIMGLPTHFSVHDREDLGTSSGKHRSVCFNFYSKCDLNVHLTLRECLRVYPERDPTGYPFTKGMYIICHAD